MFGLLRRHEVTVGLPSLAAMKKKGSGDRYQYHASCVSVLARRRLHGPRQLTRASLYSVLLLPSSIHHPSIIHPSLVVLSLNPSTMVLNS